MGNFIFFYDRINNKPDAQQNERDAELLAEVEHHIGLLGLLIGFHELDEEAGDEDGGDHDAGGAAGGDVAFGEFEIVDDESDEEGEIDQCLVKLCRMSECAGHAGTAIDKVEGPRHGGDGAHNLMVHQVAAAHKSRRDGDGDAHAVEQPEEIHLFLITEIDGPQQHGDSAAMTGQTLVSDEFPIFIHREKNFVPMRRREIIFRAIDQTMAEAKSHHAPDDGPEGETVKQFLRKILFLPNFLQGHIRQNEPYCQQDSVPPYLQTADRYGHRTDIPRD